jgi:hypothetical protein
MHILIAVGGVILALALFKRLVLARKLRLEAGDHSNRWVWIWPRLNQVPCVSRPLRVAWNDSTLVRRRWHF